MRYLSLILLIAGFSGSTLRADFNQSLLKELHGVGLKAGPMIIQSKNLELDELIIMQRAKEQLNEMQVRVFTESEYKLAAGQPFLELGVNLAQAQGPSHIYSVSLALRERAQLERPKESVVTMAVSTWQRESMGIANRTEAVMKAVDRLLRVFAEEYHKANGAE